MINLLHMKLFSNVSLRDVACCAVCVACQVFFIQPFVLSLERERITKQFQKELVEKGFAEYNPDTGVWQYKPTPVPTPTKQIKEDFSDLDRIAVVPDHFPVAKPTKNPQRNK